MTEISYHNLVGQNPDLALRLPGIRLVSYLGITPEFLCRSTEEFHIIRINLLQNDNDRSEHLGLYNLIKGLFGLIRNPTAHLPKIKFAIEEDEASDIMCTISLVHKKLDKCL